MLKKIRILLAVAVILLLTLLFLDFTNVSHKWFGWLTKVQLIPAILAVNVVVVIGLALLTLVFGRVYCSVLCPLGIMQDGISNISGRRKGKKSRFRYSGAISWLRYALLALCIVGLVAGISLVVSLLDPYAAYGRIASGLLDPAYRIGNNLLAWFAERADSYAFYSVELWIKSGISLGVAGLTLLLVGILAWRNGRTYCNTICPVGTLLGLFSRFAIFKPRIDATKCKACGLCEKSCKASCIDAQNHRIDYSRCVSCFNCLEKCKQGAIEYTPCVKGPAAAKEAGNTANVSGAGKKAGMSRLNFLSVLGTFTLAGTLKAQQLQVDGGLADIEDKKRPDRKTPLVPPGALGLQHMKQHCTACQLCVSSCPNHILIPSSKLATLMQPEMSFERGYCRPECTHCSRVCPTGAIKPLTAADKTSLSIGKAHWIKDNCVVHTDELPCTACERHCPTQAITLVAINPQDRRSLKLPVIDKELCTGCGACEHLCPSRPFSAIYVEGNVRHHSI
jgi:Polyferredoxin